MNPKTFKHNPDALLPKRDKPPTPPGNSRRKRGAKTPKKGK